MIELAKNLISNSYIAVITFFGGIVSAGLLAFITPIGSHFAARKFSRRPVFSVKSPVLPPSLQTAVHGLNNLARKGNILYGIVNGVHVGALSTRGKISEDWNVDFSKPHLRKSFLLPEPVKMRFFVDPDLISDEIGIFSEVGSQSEKYKIKYVDSGDELISSISSDAWLHLVSQSIVIDECFPVEGKTASWVRVFDGFELCIRGAKSVKIQSNNSLIASSSAYGWVLSFEDCERITIEGTVFGHTKPGYCRGGVLKFRNCKLIHVIGCDLFGCGTYGVEIEQCSDIKFTRSTIRDCTYGIMQIKESRNIRFNECNFNNNKEFDLIEITEECKDIAFSHCIVSNNYSSGYIIKLEDVGIFEVRLADCKIYNNECLSFSNDPDMVNRWNLELDGKATAQLQENGI